PAIEKGFFRREIADAAFVYQREIDTRRKLIVGVNAFQEAADKPLETLVVDEAVEEEQVARLRELKLFRENEAAQRSLGEVRRAAATGKNLMPPLLDPV